LIKTHVFYFLRWNRDLNAIISSTELLSFTIVMLPLLVLSSAISLQTSRYATHERHTNLALLIILIELNFHGSWGVCWCSPDCPNRADVCAGPTPHS
jgi:hypothetical protein